MDKEKKSGSKDYNRYHHGDLRNALIIAAAELIEESGSEDLTMIEAARRAGVSSAAPYRHFKDKGDLLWSVGELGFFDLASQLLDTQTQYSDGSVECIVEMGRCYIRFVTQRPAFFDLMWGERGYSIIKNLEERDAQTRVNGFWLLVNQVEAWCNLHQIVNAESQDLAMKLWSISIGLSHLAINHHLERFIPDVDPGELLATATHSFLDGVKGAGK